MDYIVSKMSAVDCFWYAEYGDLSAPGSMGIGLYPDGLIYVGEWADGMFEGSGKYYAASDDGETYVTLEGAFVAGIPNVQATMINEFVNGYYNESVGYTYIREEYIGNYIDGICDGEFEIRAITDGGEVHAVVDPKVTYVDGIPQKIKDFNSEKYIAGEVPGTTLVWVSDGSVEYAPGYPRDESIQAAFEEETTEEEATDAE